MVSKILCACLGNSDRSPFMEAFLKQMLTQQGKQNITVNSCGVLDSAKSGGGAPELSVKAAPTYGLDLSSHSRTHVGSLTYDLNEYDLAIVAEKAVQIELVNRGYTGEVICLELEGAANAWGSKNPRKIDEMIVAVYTTLMREVLQYKFRVG